ncbi:MAG TPA: ABC transporter permease [Pirellulales bacterium]|jgi:putative ABC transport system permease protein|nr:ABC transporter permease [Pirellulales bacterium]
MRFLTVVAKNLLRRPARSALTVFGVGLAVAAVVSLLGISDGFERSYYDLYASRGIDLVVQRSGRSQQLASGLDEKWGQRMRRLPGVREVIGGLVDVVSFEEAGLFVVLVNGWPADSPILEDVKILSGRSLTDPERHEVLLGKVLAANLGKGVGDELELYGQQFQVAGVFESYNVYDNGAVVMLLSEMQQLTDRPHEVSGFTVEADPAAGEQGIEALKLRIESLSPHLSVLSTADFVNSVAQIRMARAMAWLTSTVAVILGGIGVLNTMVMSVFERMREMGVLRAIGWSRARIVRMVLSESLLLTIVGAAAGSAGGALLARLLGNFRTTAGLIEGRVSPAVIAQGFVIALAIGLLGAVYPAYWSANLRPVDAMRHR